MGRFASISVLLMLLFSTMGCSPPPYNNISNDELQSLVDQGVTLVDIRRPEEWRETGIVKDSRTITLFDARGQLDQNFLTRLEKAAPNKAEPIALICRTGNRTQAGAKMLVEHLGYSDVYNVRNGITQWIREGRSVEKYSPNS